MHGLPLVDEAPVNPPAWIDYDLPPITFRVAEDRRDWPWAGNARYRLKLVGECLARYGRTCHLCGLPGATTADHLIPWSHGGLNVLDNLRPAHGACNFIRQDTPLKVWFTEHRIPRREALTPSREW